IVSPALNSGNFLPVANASSATLIKSMTFYFLFFYLFAVSFQRNITGLSILPASDYAEKRVQRY
ncbi:MAG: hypothetical protein IKM77_03685, partial [Prevotella sp.]|nr:hypothetical protein [Prevotella sp.]